MNLNKPEVYLDLEETVIDNWYSGNPKHDNISRIVNFLKTNQTTHVGIFSAAIYNEAHLNYFDKHHKDYIQNMLGVLIVDVVSMDRVLQEINGDTCMVYPRFENTVDAMYTLGKDNLFIEWCKATKRGKTTFLIDDSYGDVSYAQHIKGVFTSAIIYDVAEL